MKPSKAAGGASASPFFIEGDGMNSDPYMTADDFKAAQRDLGLSDRALAVSLGLSETTGHVQVRRIKNSTVACSGPIAGLMLAFLEGFRTPWFVER